MDGLSGYCVGLVIIYYLWRIARALEREQAGDAERRLKQWMP